MGDCPILLTDNDPDEGKIVNMEILKKKSLGFYPLSDKILIVAIKGNHIVFNQENILILADYEKNEEAKKEIKTKKVLLNNSKHLTFNNVKKKSKSLLMAKVKKCSGKEIGAVDMFEHIKDLDDVDDTVLSQLSAANDKKKSKEIKKADKDPKGDKSKKSSDDSSGSSDDKDSSKASSPEVSSKSSSSDSSKEDSDGSSSDKESEGSKKSESKSSYDGDHSSGDTDGEKVLTDEDEEFNQAAILSKKRMPLDKVSSERLARMSNAGNKLVLDLNRSIGELESGPSHGIARMPRPSSNPKAEPEEEKPKKPKKSSSSKK